MNLPASCTWPSPLVCGHVLCLLAALELIPGPSGAAAGTRRLQDGLVGKERSSRAVVLFQQLFLPPGCGRFFREQGPVPDSRPQTSSSSPISMQKNPGGGCQRPRCQDVRGVSVALRSRCLQPHMCAPRVSMTPSAHGLVEISQPWLQTPLES